MTCPACESKDAMISFLRDQLTREQGRTDKLSDQIVTMADPYALGRVQSAQRGPQPVTDAKPRQVPSPAMMRVRNPDRPTKEQLAEYAQAREATQPDLAATTYVAPSVEKSFESKTG